MKPKALQPTPPTLLVLLGGLVGMLLLFALLHLAPAAGLPLIDVPRLLGGVFVGNADAAFWLGAVLFLLGGVFVFPFALMTGWFTLPGEPTTLTGAALKGAAFGLGVFVLQGLVLPLLGAINQVPGLDNPGFFGLAHGVGGLAVLLVAHVGYGLAAGMIAGMVLGLDLILMSGWPGYKKAAPRENALERVHTHAVPRKISR